MDLDEIEAREEDQSSSDNEELDEEPQEMETESSDANKREVYLPGKPLEEGEELTCDPSAYIMYHQAQTSAPCLSFDIIPDGLGRYIDVTILKHFQS